LAIKFGFIAGQALIVVRQCVGQGRLCDTVSSSFAIGDGHHLALTDAIAG